jgi:hypothetical protein
VPEHPPAERTSPRRGEGRRAATAPAVAKAPVAAAPDASALVGTNQTMPLLSVVQFLGRMRKTGCLRVKVGQETMAFEFVTGCVHAASSSHVAADERLGHILVELGFVTAEVIAEAGKVDRRKLAAMLVKAGHVTEDQVVDAYERQTYKRLHRACQTPDASYEFTEGARSAADGPVGSGPIDAGENRKSDKAS